MNEILILLENEDRTARDLGQALGWKLTKVYAALIALEAQKAVEVLFDYRKQNQRPIALWSKCEVTV